MLEAQDFRRLAREALKGQWLKAGIATLIAGILGGSITPAGSGISDVVNEISDFVEEGHGVVQISPAVLAALTGAIQIIFIWSIVTFIIGGATALGYAKYNLNLVDHKTPEIRDVFSQYHRMGAGFIMAFLTGLYIVLWTLLLVIPGIIATYSYSMAPLILAENPEMTGSEAIRESKELMRGNKWRLFCLEFSFIGWALLLAVIFSPIIFLIASSNVLQNLTAFLFLGIVIIVYTILMDMTLGAYMSAAKAAFYRDIKDQACSSSYADAEVVYETTQEDEKKETFL